MKAEGLGDGFEQAKGHLTQAGQHMSSGRLSFGAKPIPIKNYKFPKGMAWACLQPVTRWITSGSQLDHN